MANNYIRSYKGVLFMYTLLKFTKTVDFYTTFCYDVKVYKKRVYFLYKLSHI
ncbi:hypothetical protein SAMN05216587_10874 [Selenomonas ruminantium]|uniref:Uncharacterized protein n=1 Tax=Selenomonas ruminantium TaxID=971 RepID=A0A1I0XZZ4_SELRU|nr:hypothetical protein SAMN05216587_10874 [Selenomonas ruminantium]